ncbi:MAG: DMT family transporter [Planctomycetota bacterium]
MNDSDTPSGFGTLEGAAAVVFTLVGWSSVPLFLKHFSHSIDAWTSNGWRYAFAALLWLPVILLHTKRRTLPQGIYRAALLPSAFNIVGQVCFTSAHYLIDPGLLTFGLRVHIVFVAIGALLLFPAERRVIKSLGFIAGAVLVMGGTMATILLGSGLGGGATVGGVALAIASGLLFACYGLSVRRCMIGYPSLTSFAVISQYTAAGMLLLMVTLGERAGLTALDLPLSQFGLLLLSALIGIALGHVAYYISIDRLGVAVSSGVIQLQPFFVSLGSLWLFGETLSTGQWSGGAVAIAGAIVMLWTQHTLAQRDKRSRAAGALEELPVDHVAAASEAERDPR